MTLATAIATTALTGLLLGGCADTSPPRGLASASYSNNHTTAAGGYGLGPENFNTNGGAFGPEDSH